MKGFVLLLLFMSLVNDNFAQTNELSLFHSKDLYKSEMDSSIQEINYQKTSNYFVNGTIGFTEFFSIVVGFYIDSNQSLGLKLNNILVRAQSSYSTWASAIGIRYSFKIPGNLFIRNITMSFSNIIDIVSIPKIQGALKGFCLEITTGKSLSQEKGFSFIYEFGFILSKVKNEKSYFYPNLKLGTNFNF